MKLEKVIGDYLRDHEWTLSIAESCTGGLVCDHITDVPGSSDYFEGGMVTYSNESKAKYLGVPLKDLKRYGAVSSQVAIAMAQGVRKAFHTTYGLSITGIAGPSGGSKKKPVGLIFIGISDGRRCEVKEERLKGTRREVKKESAHLSLKHLYHFITKVHPNN